MAGTTTAMCASFKAELMQGGHNFNQTINTPGTTHTNTTLDGLASTAGIAVGMAVSGTGIAASTFVAAITSAVAIVLSVAATGSATNTMAFTGDQFKIALVKASPSGTFDKTMTNIGTPGVGSPGTANLGTDEMTNTTGVAYTSGGAPLTNSNTPAVGGDATTAITSFSNVSWTSATFTASGAIIYNTTTRLGGAAAPLNGRTVSVHDFGGNQSVSNGTFTITMPAVTAASALLRIG